MTSRWANGGAVQEQIDSTIEDAITRARNQLPCGESLTYCEGCDAAIPEARRRAIPGVCLCVGCQAKRDRGQTEFSGYSRHSSKGSQLR